jgi:flagellar basal-body rod modification protein FlgD
MIETVTDLSTAANQANATGGLGSFDFDTFLQLLVAQLQNQNALESMDATAMLQQTSQFANVEAIQQVAQLQQELLGFQQFSVAAAVIGKQVDALGPTGEVITGVVTAVRASGEGPVL